MKKQFLLNALLMFCMAIMVVSCDKKETMDMGAMDITMAYTPNPAVKNKPVVFTFDVKQDGMAQAVTNTKCEVLMSGMPNQMMTITEKTPGQYTGTYTFTMEGTYELHFKYMHENVDTDMDFTCVVQ